MALGSDSLLKTLSPYADKLFYGSFSQSTEEQDFTYSFATNQLYQKEKSNHYHFLHLAETNVYPAFMRI